MAEVAIVTGGTSGIGKYAAETLRDRGCRVWVFSRRPASLAGMEHLSVDVTDEAAVQEAVQTVLEKEGRIDILVNCAGFGISGAVEFTDSAEAKRQMDVNFFGMVNVSKAVIPYMREAGKGTIVNISSVAGPVPIPFQTFYSASKAAINAYTLATANELRPYGVKMCAVQPGDIRTGFTDAREKSAAGDEVYGGAVSRSVSRMEKDERGGVSPDKVAKKVLRLAQKKRVSPLHAVGFVYGLCVLLMRILPSGLANRILGMLYAN